MTMTSVERIFSTMNFVKNSLRNRINDLLDDCLVIFIERDVFSNVKNEAILLCSTRTRSRFYVCKTFLLGS
jgi:hypothetical protein